MHLFSYRYAYQTSNIIYYWVGFKHFSGEGRPRDKMSPGSWLDTLPKIQRARHGFNTLKSEYCLQTQLLSVTSPWLQSMAPSCGEMFLFWHSFTCTQMNPKFLLQMVSPALKQRSAGWQQHCTDSQGVVHCGTKRFWALEREKLFLEQQTLWAPQ